MHGNISVRLQYTLSWADERLFGIAPSWVPVSPSLVWSPPLAFGQSVRRVTAEEEGDSTMWLDPRGLVVYKMTRLLTLNCVAKLERYPLDTQVCQVVLYAYNGIRLRLQPSQHIQNAPIKVDARGIVSQFILVGTEQKAGFKSFRENVTDCQFFQQICDYRKETCLTSLSDACNGTVCANCNLVIGDCQQQLQSCEHYINDTSAHTSLEVNIRLRRVLSHYILANYLPSIVLVLAAFLQTWLPLTPATVSARVVLGTTAVLSMILQTGKATQMPWVKKPRAMDIWMLGCLSLVIAALLETVVAHYISTYIQEKEQKEIRKEEQKRRRNPAILIPRPGLKSPGENLWDSWRFQGCQHTINSQPVVIPRARLRTPGPCRWHELPTKEWVVVVKQGKFKSLQKKDIPKAEVGSTALQHTHQSCNDSAVVTYVPHVTLGTTHYRNIPAFNVRSIGPSAAERAEILALKIDKATRALLVCALLLFNVVYWYIFHY
ncbi:glycine receptor subunit alpha-4-like [Branchiostoma lanceolatum]|uniref:glycine receptor subunit alpha-4-like n=1 Tax=Branchiostoma lanceolatum TaxID=7740 RepID=UPI0034569988